MVRPLAYRTFMNLSTKVLPRIPPHVWRPTDGKADFEGMLLAHPYPMKTDTDVREQIEGRVDALFKLLPRSQEKFLRLSVARNFLVQPALNRVFAQVAQAALFRCVYM